MRNRALLALVVVAAAIFVFGVAGLIVSGRQSPDADFVAAPRGTPAPGGPQTLQLRPGSSPEPSPVSSPEGSPDETAAAYFQAWVKSDYDAMRELVDEPPDDFADEHREFEDAALSKSLRITVGNLVRTGDETAEIPFTQERDEQDAGTWRFDSSLHLAVRDLTWKVVWTPSVLHPEIQPGGSLVRTEPEVGPLRPVTRTGRELPQNSGADAYLDNLMNQGVAPATGVAVGWALEVDNPGMPAKTVLSYKPEKRPVGVRTTIDYAVQAAAARALDGVQRAAIVAVRASTGRSSRSPTGWAAGRRSSASTPPDRRSRRSRRPRCSAADCHRTARWSARRSTRFPSIDRSITTKTRTTGRSRCARRSPCRATPRSSG
ncbi:hypothetical protein GCM10027612_74860 [Microbispora bryophytorum subsp. camponoti]